MVNSYASGPSVAYPGAAERKIMNILIIGRMSVAN
jgi:hypothetical protein